MPSSAPAREFIHFFDGAFLNDSKVCLALQRFKYRNFHQVRFVIDPETPTMAIIH